MNDVDLSESPQKEKAALDATADAADDTATAPKVEEGEAQTQGQGQAMLGKIASIQEQVCRIFYPRYFVFDSGTAGDNYETFAPRSGGSRWKT